MQELAVEIVRCVDDQHQPGWLECAFLDAESRRHTLIDKVPIFSLERPDTKSTYPRPGAVACEILNNWRDPLGRELVRITIDRPYHVESTEKLAEFVVASCAALRGAMKPRVAARWCAAAFLNPAIPSNHHL